MVPTDPIGQQATGLDAAAMWRLVGALAAQTTVFTALLFYFGWVRTQTLLSFFGLDAAILNMSPSDFMVRSLPALWKPIIVYGLLVLLALFGHALLVGGGERRREPRGLKRVGVACLVVSAGLLVAGLVGFVDAVTYSPTYPFVPIFMGLGILVGSYGAWLLIKSGRVQFSELVTRVGGLTVIALLTLLVFWLTAVYADLAGRQQAAALDLRYRPGVVIYSDRDLALSGPGVTTETVTGSNTAFSYKYRGYRLLITVDGRYVLVPEASRNNGRNTVVLDEQPGIRFEFFAGEG